MAKGDVKPIVYHSTRMRGGSGSSSQSVYDDEGRGASKNLWEWFEHAYTNAQDRMTWMMDMEDDTCYNCIHNSTHRFGIMDIAFEYSPDGDSRARRMIVKDKGKEVWNRFHTHLVEGYHRVQEKMQRERQQAANERDQNWAVYLAQREAERAVVARTDFEYVRKIVDMTVGFFTSEFNQAFSHTDKSGNEAGDWIDDPVASYIDGSGYGYEIQKAVGLKLQVTLSLDLSNSMYYNSVHKTAASTFRDLGMTLKQLQAEHPGDMFVGFFTFGEDAWQGRGKRARCIGNGDRTQENEYDLMEFSPYRPSIVNNWSGLGAFEGTDTYISMLFKEIESWEREHSDPGAVKLDLIITDAVLEHPGDIVAADLIQERRDGALQSVMVNFMSQDKWLNSTLPRRCFEIAVSTDNVAGILRNVLSEFVGVQL